MNEKWVVVFALALVATAGSALAAEDVFPGTTGPFENRAALGVPCVCGFDPDGDTFCSTGVLCDDLQECDDALDCPDGFRCLVDNCCPGTLGQGACVPVCDDVECINPGTCETFEECEAPLFVELESFEAEVVDGVVRLYWTTASEIDNAGFRILRARRDGARIRKNAGDTRQLQVSLELLTQRLVPAEGSALTGASYRYTDGAPHRPGTVSYYLVDVDYSGVATLHGPVSVEIPRRGGRR